MFLKIANHEKGGRGGRRGGRRKRERRAMKLLMIPGFPKD